MITPKPLELESWHFKRMFTPHHVSCITCHMAHVMCHVSHVTCHLSVGVAFGISDMWQVTCDMHYVTPDMSWKGRTVSSWAALREEHILKVLLCLKGIEKECTKHLCCSEMFFLFYNRLFKDPPYLLKMASKLRHHICWFKSLLEANSCTNQLASWPSGKFCEFF